MTRLLIIADTHCGHQLGLCPHEYANEFNNDSALLGFEFYSNTVKELKPDKVLLNGDLVDGVLLKDTTQMVTTDIYKQQEIAIRCLEEIPGNPDMIFTRGTPVHTSSNGNDEDIIAQHFKYNIYDDVNFQIEDLIIHARHTGGKGGTAYGSATSLQRSAIVQYLNDSTKDIKADLFIRSHIHEYNLIERSLLSILSTPCLQFSGTAYGRKCTGFYDYGISWIDIDGKDFTVYKRLLSSSSGAKKEVVLL